MAKGDGASAYARRNERARAEGYRSYYEKRTVEAVARGKSLAVARGHGRGEYHRDHVRIIHAQAGRRGQVFRVRQYEVGNPQIDNERSRATPVSADTLLLAIKRYVGTKPGFVRVAVYGIFDYRANARVLRWAGFAMPRREALDQLTEIRDAVEQERVLRAIALRGGMPRPLTKAEHTRLESQVRTVENRLLAEWVSSHLNVYGVDEHNRPISATPCERVFAVSVAPSFAYLPQEPDDDDSDGGATA